MSELILGSKPAIWMFASGHSMARALWYFGTAERKCVRSLPSTARVACTIVLTEPDAGSDVGGG